jgi:hypothetical protein
MKRFIVFFVIVLSIAASLLALPATDARFLNIEITYHLQSDGSWDMEYQHQVRLDTYYAVNRALGETFIVYNPDFQKLEILKAETTMVDGHKVAAPVNAFNEVLPFAAHGFSDFSNLREMVVTHTGLERGAIVDLHYRIQTKAGFLPVFSGREVLAKAFPVDAYKLKIMVPANQVLRYRIFGLQADPEISSAGIEKHCVITLKNIKSFIPEPLSSELAAPRIVFSTAADWRQALAIAGGPSQLPAVLADRIAKLKTQTLAGLDLLAALQKIVAVDFQNCTLGPVTAGWQPRASERVALSNYGTSLEKALLLQDMLQKAGLESELLAVAAGMDFAKDVPTVLQMGEFWLKIGDGSQTLYLDPSHEQQEFLPTRCQGFAAFNLKSGQLETLPAADWDQNGVDIFGTVTLEPAAVSGSLTVAARGIFNRYADAAESNTKFVEGLLKKIFPVEQVEIKKLLVLTRQEFRAEVTFSGKWLKDVGAGFFSVDACRLPGLPENIIQQNQRETPLLLDAPFKISLYLDLQSTAGLSLDYFAPQVEKTNEVGYFSRSHSLEKNGHIRFSETCGILKTPVRAELYSRLRELLKAYFTPDFWLVFKKSK